MTEMIQARVNKIGLMLKQVFRLISFVLSLIIPAQAGQALNLKVLSLKILKS